MKVQASEKVEAEAPSRNHAIRPVGGEKLHEAGWKAAGDLQVGRPDYYIPGHFEGKKGSRQAPFGTC